MMEKKRTLQENKNGESFIEKFKKEHSREAILLSLSLARSTPSFFFFVYISKQLAT